MKVADSQHETNAVEDVGFATAIQTSDGIELWIEVFDLCPCGIGLKPIDDDALQRVSSHEPIGFHLDVHGELLFG